MGENFNINGNLIELSEVNYKNDSSRKYAKFLLCPLDESNANGKGIKSTDLTELELQTLVGQPLVTNVVFNSKTNRYEFTGHEVRQKYSIDNNGSVVRYNDFTTTSPIGYHTSASIENIELNGVIKPCIVAECCLWTRYTNAMEVIQRLGNNLKTSWELAFDSSYEENGTIWLKGINFLANCMLESSTPAYSDAGLLEVASKQEDELSLAMIKDLEQLNKNHTEISDMNKLNKNEGGCTMAEENKPNLNVQMVAYSEVEQKISEIQNSLDEANITISERDKSIEVLNNEIAELKEQLSQKETELSTKVDEIVKLGETIKSNEEVISAKDSVIAELAPIKEKYEAEMAEKAEAEKKEKMEALKAEALSSKYVTEKDFEENEALKTALSELDEKTIKAFIADRVIEQASKAKENKQAEEVSEKEDVEVSSVDLSSTQEYNYADDFANDPIARYLNKRNKR